MLPKRWALFVSKLSFDAMRFPFIDSLKGHLLRLFYVASTSALNFVGNQAYSIGKFTSIAVMTAFSLCHPVSLFTNV